MRFVWFDLAIVLAAIAALFALIPRVKAENKFVAVVVFVAAVLLTGANVYLKGSTGHGLEDYVVCAVYPSGQWCRDVLRASPQAETDRADAPDERGSGRTEEASEPAAPPVQQSVAPPPTTEAARDTTMVAADITAQEIETVFRAYVAAWQSGDVAGQDALLDESFTYIDQEGERQSRSAYLRQKRELAAKYGAGESSGAIRIGVSNVSVETSGDTGSLSYDQSYESPYYSSIGRNRFNMRKRDNAVKITEEIFRRESFSRRKP